MGPIKKKGARSFWGKNKKTRKNTIMVPMETMVCARTAESLQTMDKNGKALKQVENFKYLGSVIHAQGGNEKDITAKIAAA